MKTALDAVSLSPIQAEDGAPRRALCPHCGAAVILRLRRRDGGLDEVTYFWCHEAHANPHCPARLPAIRQFKEGKR